MRFEFAGTDQGTLARCSLARPLARSPAQASAHGQDVGPPACLDASQTRLGCHEIEIAWPSTDDYSFRGPGSPQKPPKHVPSHAHGVDS